MSLYFRKTKDQYENTDKNDIIKDEQKVNNTSTTKTLNRPGVEEKKI